MLCTTCKGTSKHIRYGNCRRHPKLGPLLAGRDLERQVSGTVMRALKPWRSSCLQDQMATEGLYTGYVYAVFPTCSGSALVVYHIACHCAARVTTRTQPLAGSRPWQTDQQSKLKLCQTQSGMRASICQRRHWCSRLLQRGLTHPHACCSPWCYMGKRRLERAMKQLSDRADFKVHW